MQVNVSQLLKSAIGTARNYVVSEVIDITGSSVGSPVEGEVKLIHTDWGILVKGALHTEVEVTCVRCLSSSSCPLTMNIEEEYFPTTDVFSGVPLALPDEPGCFTIDKHHTLDLTEAIRQNALLAIPMKPLCHEDCAGLCPSCGQNLNQGPCGCPSQRTDHRWAELNKLVLSSGISVNKGKGKG